MCIHICIYVQIVYIVVKMYRCIYICSYIQQLRCNQKHTTSQRFKGDSVLTGCFVLKCHRDKLTSAPAHHHHTPSRNCVLRAISLKKCANSMNQAVLHSATYLRSCSQHTYREALLMTAKDNYGKTHSVYLEQHNIFTTCKINSSH